MKEGVRNAFHYSKWMSSKMGLSLRLKNAKEIDLKKDNELFAIF